MHRCRSDILELIPADQAQLVEWIAVPHQSAYAIRKLKQLGSRAVPSLRHGLKHPEHLVRVGCCIVLDHVYDDSCLPGLIENLNHPHPDVRKWALHALACDRCKKGVCRPAENLILDPAIRLLLYDPERKVRQMAAGMLGPSVHRSPEVLHALQQAHRSDNHPAVRKVCSWWVPGGTCFVKSLP